MKSRSFIKGSIAFAMALTMAVGGTGIADTGISTAAAKVKLSKSKLSITKGDTATLKVKNTKKKVKWKTSSKKIVKVTKTTGKKKEEATITGVKPGKAVVIAKIGKKKLKCKITVKKPVDNFKSVKMDTYDSKCVLLSLKKADNKLKEEDITATTKKQKSGKYTNQVDVKKVVKVSKKLYRVYLDDAVKNGYYINLSSGVSTADTQQKQEFYAAEKKKEFILKKDEVANVCLHSYVKNGIGNVKFTLKKGSKLPTGLVLDNKYSEIKGIPTEVGATTVTMVAKDELGRSTNIDVKFNVYDDATLAVADQEQEIEWSKKDAENAVAYNEYNKTALDAEKKYLKDYTITPYGGSGVYTFTLDAGGLEGARLSTDIIADDAAKTVTQRKANHTKLCIPYSIAAGTYTLKVTATDVLDPSKTCVSTITLNVVQKYNATGAVKSTNGQKISGVDVYLIPKGAKDISEAYTTEISGNLTTAGSDIGSYSVSVPSGTYTVKVQGDVMYEMTGKIKVGKEDKVAQITVPEKFYAVSGKVTYSNADNELRNKTLYFETKTNKYEQVAFTTTTDDDGAFALSLPSNTYSVFYEDEKGNRKYFSGQIVVKDKDQVVTMKSSQARYKVEGAVFNGTSLDAASQYMDTIKNTTLYFYNPQGICVTTEVDNKGTYKVFLEGSTTYTVRADFGGTLRTIGTITVGTENMVSANLSYAATKDAMAAAAVEYGVDKIGTAQTILSTGANDILWKFTPATAGKYGFDISTVLNCGAKVAILDENLKVVAKGTAAADEYELVTEAPVATDNAEETAMPTRTPSLDEVKHDFEAVLEAGKIYFVQVIPNAASKYANGQGQGDVKLMISGPIVEPTATPRVTYYPGWDDENGTLRPTGTPNYGWEDEYVTPTPTSNFDRDNYWDSVYDENQTATPTPTSTPYNED